MTPSRQRWMIAIAIAMAFPAVVGAQTVIRQVIGSGAVASVSPTHAIGGTIGQTIIGRSTSSTHSASLGFWYTYPFGTTTGVREDRGITGTSAAVHVSPNPVTANATVMIALPRSGDVQLAVFDRLGRERARLIDGWREAGTTTVDLSARELESGDYLLVLLTDGVRTSAPLRVIK